MRLLAKPTPFPYTTLFRSARGAEHIDARLAQRQADVGVDHLRAGDDREVLQEGLAPVAEVGRLDRNGLEGLAEDRKSTRLNSSHVATSYAVFCLKKKKEHI